MVGGLVDSIDLAWSSLPLREVAIVLFQGDCSQHIPSQGTAHVHRERLYLVVVDAYLSGANSSPPGHSIQRNVLTGMFCTQATASTGSFELALTGGISSCRRQLGSNNFCRILLTRLLGDGYC